MVQEILKENFAPAVPLKAKNQFQSQKRPVAKVLGILPDTVEREFYWLSEYRNRIKISIHHQEI